MKGKGGLEETERGRVLFCGFGQSAGERHDG